jgi:hypothetical protein
MSTVPALFWGLVDDAALFPPGNAPMARAVAEHRHHRAAAYGDLVGRFLCPVSRFDELRAELGDGPPLTIGLIADTGPAGLAAVGPAVLAEPRVTLELVECVAPPSPDLVESVRTVAASITSVVPEKQWLECYVEVPRAPAWRQALAELCSWGWETRVVGAKLRTGGLSAEAFPSDEELADFIAECLRLGLPFKLTAGLHRAIRHTAAKTGFEHHGYLNALAAVVGTSALVAERRAEPLLAVLSPQLDDPRHGFRSYGSCSIAEPLEDLVALGLLDAALLSDLPAGAEEHM